MNQTSTAYPPAKLFGQFVDTPNGDVKKAIENVDSDQPWTVQMMEIVSVLSSVNK